MKNITPMGFLKNIYVSAIRLVRPLAKKSGLLSALEARSHLRWAHWLRSLAAIHDIDDMISLDVPWWTYDAINEIEAFLTTHPNARVLEFGSGASTVWLGHRAGSVKSIEHDSDWYNLVKQRVRLFSNVEIVLRKPEVAMPDGKYTSAKGGFKGLSFRNYVCEAKNGSNPYDLIIIDGRARNDCFEIAKLHLVDGGLILFDNTLRKRYRDAILASDGNACHFPGRVPSLPYRDETSLISFPQKGV